MTILIMMISMNRHSITMAASSSLSSSSIRRDIIESRDLARCFRHEGESLLVGSDFCYVPNVCVSRNGTIKLKRGSIDRLARDNVLDVFQNVWNYGPFVEFVDEIPEPNDRRVVFISCEKQGATHFANSVALPLTHLIDPRVRNFLNIPKVTTIWNKLFEPNQHNTEQWIREVVSIFQARFGIESVSGLFNRETVCFDTIMYGTEHRSREKTNNDVFNYPNTIRDFRRMVLTSIASGECKTDNNNNNNDKLVKTTFLLQRKSKTRNRGVATRQFRNIKLVRDSISHLSEETHVIAFEDKSFHEQASIMRDTDIFIAPHGNANINIMFMRECSIMIELFPFKFRTEMFELLARSRNVVYRSWESEIPRSSCLEKYHDLSKQECWEDWKLCRPCARDVAFISPPPDTIAQILKDSIREREVCLEKKKKHGLKTIRDYDKEKNCKCPNGEFVNANGTIYYCDETRLVRVLNWDTCTQLGSKCTSPKVSISKKCLMRLSFLGETIYS